MQYPEINIFNIKTDKEFESDALKLFKFQAHYNPVYKQYITYLNIKNPADISGLKEIPCMPVGLFKSHQIKTGEFKAENRFESSGTEGSGKSVHYIKNIDLYRQSVIKGFNQFYGNPGRFAFFALLPSYIERKNASLVYMAKTLMEQNPDGCGGFYLKKNDTLKEKIKKAEKIGYQTILLGVSFALIDLAKNPDIDLRNAIIIETGGMKGMQKEIIRDELHNYLRKKLHPKAIHSEYGMTEMLSQAYKQETEGFMSPPWLKILIRDMYDPGKYVQQGQHGLINIIDLANTHSCAFLQTNDTGKITPDGFTVSGRLDHSDIRGCNLMV
ncbi:MAG: acyl transferase [Bacteroidota bacterium]